MYVSRVTKIKSNPILSCISKECGSAYKQTVETFWKEVEDTGTWIKKKDMQKIIKSENVHAHTLDAVTDDFYSALAGWRELRKNHPETRPPTKTREFRSIVYKSSAIRLRDGHLILSNGKKSPSVSIPWKHGLPKMVRIKWNGNGHDIHCIYSVEPIEKSGEEIVAIDLGEVHPIALSNGILVNGGELRSKKRYREKKKGEFSKKLKRTKSGSRRDKSLKKAKKRVLTKIENQIKDILHKTTTWTVNILRSRRCGTLVVGDVTNIRQNNDVGRKNNQKIHQWDFSRISWYLKYKSERAGISYEDETEEYTSRTCPRCGHVRSKPRGRVFRCPKCKFRGHRDIVGSMNILAKRMKKYPGGFVFQVVADMAPATGVRWKPDISVASWAYAWEEAVGL